MLLYILGGAVIGAVIGHLVPPGSLFWFVVGAVSGCVAQRFWGRHY
jgi:hypothetical protein